MDGRFLRFAAEEVGEFADCSPVGNTARDVRPLARIRALGEEATELVERRPTADEPVRMVIDERDPV
jgi:hypothetical protein